MLVSHFSDHFPIIYQYKSADQAHHIAIASSSNLPFFNFGDTELSLLNSHLTNQQWGGLVSESGFNRSFDLFYDSVKEGILEVITQGPVTNTSKRKAPLDPYKTPGLNKSWKRKNYFLETLQGFITCSSSSTVKGL